MISAIELRKASIEEIWEYVHTEEGQDEITAFTDRLREEVGNRAAYVAKCQEGQEGIGVYMTSDFWLELLVHFDRFIQATPPGHDPNHIYRDFLAAFALASDPYVGKAQYQADVVAAVLGAGLHDIGNAVTHRYQDTERKAGHAEIGAWLFFHWAKDLVAKPARILAAYAIAAHTHYLKPLPVNTPEGFTRQPYWYEVWTQDEGPVGLAPLLTRFADRLDTNGVTLFARHLLAQADAVESGGGKDITGDQFYEVNQEALSKLFLPEVREGGPKPPTTLEHMGNFARSNFGSSVYSRDDHLFPLMTHQLMLTKVIQSRQLTEAVTKARVNMEAFSATETRALVKGTLRQISGSPHFDRSWQILAKAWNALPPEHQAKWQAGFGYIRTAYVGWLSQLATLASKADAFEYSAGTYESIAWELVDRCL